MKKVLKRKGNLGSVGKMGMGVREIGKGCIWCMGKRVGKMGKGCKGKEVREIGKWSKGRCVTFGLHFTTQIHWTASFLFSFLFLTTEAHVQYNLVSLPDTTEVLVRYNLVNLLDMIQTTGSFLYNIHLRATPTTILSIRGVTIPIYLVSRATDSFRQCIVLFKTAVVWTSDPKSEFLCQLSISCEEPADSP